MRTANSPTFNPQWEDLTYNQLDSAQLHKFSSQLDLLLLALAALTKINASSLLEAVSKLNLESKLPDYLTWWQQQPANLLPPQGQAKLDVDGVRAKVLIVCYLAKQHQELIRRAVALLEQQVANNQQPQEVALLGDYLNTFIELAAADRADTQPFQMLVDLLFLSGFGGHRRLWSTLIG